MKRRGRDGILFRLSSGSSCCCPCSLKYHLKQSVRVLWKDTSPTAPETHTDTRLPARGPAHSQGIFKHLLAYPPARLHAYPTRSERPRSALLLVGIKSSYPFYHFELITSAFFSPTSPTCRLGPVPLLCAVKAPAPFLHGTWQSSSSPVDVHVCLISVCFPSCTCCFRAWVTKTVGFILYPAPCLPHSKSFINICLMLK